MRIQYEDNIVIVYDKDGKEVYRGLEDYEPMKDDEWVYDEKADIYRMKGYGYTKKCIA